MKHINSLIFLSVFLVMLVSCGKDSDVDGNLEGTWQVKKVEGQQYTNGNPGILVTDNNPTGTIEFKSNGQGRQDYSFTLFGTSYPQNNNFRWSSTASEIVIDVVGGSDLVWTRELNESSKQVASYDIVINLSSSIKYTLTLEK